MAWSVLQYMIQYKRTLTGLRADIYGHTVGQKQLPEQIVVDQPGKNGRIALSTLYITYSSWSDLVLKVPHLILAPDAAHSRMRRNLAHAFSAAAIREQEPLIKTHFDKMVIKMKELAAICPSGRVDMEKMYNCVAFDIIGDLAFGNSFGALDRYEYHTYMIGVFKNLKVFSIFQRLSVYPLALKSMGLLMQFIPAAVKGRARHFAFAAERVKERIATPTERRDFFWYILQHNEKSE